LHQAADRDDTNLQITKALISKAHSLAETAVLATVAIPYMPLVVLPASGAA
jgi:hypothetical protein